jgi:glutamate--cysteine ligase catalytic subunit
MEVQLTDFENAAFTTFITLITRALLCFDLDLLVPLSKVDDNMERAHVPEAASSGKFWFRSNIRPTCSTGERDLPDRGVEEMSMHEIMNGKGEDFVGLVPLCHAYLDHIQCSPQSFPRIYEYLDFIRGRSSGALLTPATWMRRFVRGHSDYQLDSVVSQKIAYDMLQACNEIGLGLRACPELLGGVTVQPIVGHTSYAKNMSALHEVPHVPLHLHSCGLPGVSCRRPVGKPSALRRCRPSRDVPLQRWCSSPPLCHHRSASPLVEQQLLDAICA